MDFQGRAFRASEITTVASTGQARRFLFNLYVPALKRELDFWYENPMPLTSFHYANPLLERFGSNFFKHIPKSAGVYFMHHADESILYIGKAKDLHARLASYKQAKPGAAAEHTLEMLENVATIRWEEHKSEEAALLRENELLHAIRPPFNIAGTEAQHYLYIGIRPIPRRTGPGPSTVHFQLTSRREIARSYRLFGCFKYRRRIKTGYTALLRLLHAASSDRKRFSFPARICRSSPPYLYSMTLPQEFIAPLDQFLAGKSAALLQLVMQRLLENEDIPRFMHPALQDDFETVQDFYRLGPKTTMKLRTRHGIRHRNISHRRMDELIKKSYKAGSLT